MRACAAAVAAASLCRVPEDQVCASPCSSTTTPAGGSASAAQHPAVAAARPGVSQSQCEGALNFLAALLGLLLPLLFVIKTESGASLARWEARRRAWTSPAARGSGSSCGGPLRCVARAWRKVETALEEAVRGLAGRSWLAARPPPPDPLFASEWERCLACLLLLAVTWAWCAAVASGGAANS